MHMLLLQIMVDLIPSYFPQPRPACGSSWIGFVCGEWWEIYGHVCCSWSNWYPSWWTTVTSEASENTSFLLDWVQKCGSGTLMDTHMTQTRSSSFFTFDSQSMIFLVECTNCSHKLKRKIEVWHLVNIQFLHGKFSKLFLNECELLLYGS